MTSHFSHCIFLVGLPGSGKSTAAKGFNEIRIESSDDIIETAARVKGKTYDEVFKDEIALADTLFKKNVAMNAKCGHDMIIDRTNLNIKSRKSLIDLVNQNSGDHSYIFTALTFLVTDDEEWNRRLESRIGKTIPKNILISMKNSFVVPSLEEGFSNILISDMFQNQIEWIEK